LRQQTSVNHHHFLCLHSQCFVNELPPGIEEEKGCCCFIHRTFSNDIAAVAAANFISCLKMDLPCN
jgi:hypothetical protein